MNIIDVLKKRYSTKEFDNTKKLTEDEINQVEELLRLSASSTNIQPWHFISATTEEGKNKIALSAHDFFSFNKDKITDASMVVVFASMVDLTEDYLNKLSEKEDEDGRFPEKQYKEQNHGARSIFAKMHKYEYKDFQHWCDKQVYLNLGNFLLGVAALGFDAIAMEGVDLKLLDKEFNLLEKGYTSSIVVSIGYAKQSDFNKSLPKSRLSKEDIITKI